MKLTEAPDDAVTLALTVMVEVEVTTPVTVRLLPGEPAVVPLMPAMTHCMPGTMPVVEATVKVVAPEGDEDRAVATVTAVSGTSWITRRAGEVPAPVPTVWRMLPATDEATVGLAPETPASELPVAVEPPLPAIRKALVPRNDGDM